MDNNENIWEHYVTQDHIPKLNRGESLGIREEDLLKRYDTIPRAPARDYEQYVIPVYPNSDQLPSNIKPISRYFDNITIQSSKLTDNPMVSPDREDINQQKEFVYSVDEHKKASLSFKTNLSLERYQDNNHASREINNITDSKISKLFYKKKLESSIKYDLITDSKKWKENISCFLCNRKFSKLKLPRHHWYISLIYFLKK